MGRNSKEEGIDQNQGEEATSVMVSGPTLRCASTPGSSIPLTKKQQKNKEKNARKRQRKAESTFNDAESTNQCNPMGFKKLQLFIETYQDPAEFLQKLSASKPSYMNQFTTKQPFKADHLGYIAQSLLRIQTADVEQDWCMEINGKIETFMKNHILAKLLLNEISQETIEAFKRYRKCKEYFDRLSGATTATATASVPSGDVLELRMDVDDTIDDFRMMSIFPNTSDILDDPPFIDKNIVKGAYDNVDHYLDVQFRLFREDFIQPLRNGIKEYQKYIKLVADKRIASEFTSLNLNIYRNIKMLEPKLSQNGFTSHCKLDCGTQFEKHLKFKLKSGSLVCFSDDGFSKSFYFATLCQNINPESVESEVYSEPTIVRFKIAFETENHHSTMPDINKTYDMIESTKGYFEVKEHFMH